MNNKKEFSWTQSTNNSNTYSSNLNKLDSSNLKTNKNKGGRPKIESKKVQFTIKINPILAKKIKEYSEQTGFGWTTIFEQALQVFLDKNK